MRANIDLRRFVPIARITRNVFDHREWPTRLVDVRSRNEACASA